MTLEHVGGATPNRIRIGKIDRHEFHGKIGRGGFPFKRFAKPQEIADAILFFASSRSDYVTGQVLSVSGGLTFAG